MERREGAGVSTYSKLLDEMNHLARAGVETGTVGASADGRLIPYVFAGSHTGKTVLVTGGIHAREHISVFCVVKQIYRALNRSAHIARFGGVYFIPMLNPDGNEIVIKGADALTRVDKKPVAAVLAESDRRLYKANARGVDLNVNFDARWGTGAQNVFSPAAAHFVGTAPFSEPETRSLRDFTLKILPAATVSYHAIGRELYYEFGQTGAALARDRRIAEKLNETLRYTLKPDDGSSSGGYKDWCIAALGIPAFTVELVDERHPHPFYRYDLASEDIERNLDVPERLLSIMNNE
jgi:g-D-glutamyl-meso-diaminopimelate peptidase